jgi:subtilisin family serine protease
MLDSGIDYLHADLVGRVDLTRSADMLGSYYHPLANGDSVLVTEADTVTKYFGAGQLAISDLLFHGTHTSATVSSNAARAAGITSGTKLVALKVCSYLDECPFSSILRAVISGADNGADVMNLSLGGAFPKKGNKDVIKLINKVFEYATHRGVTVVVSAGNEATDLDHDPTNYHSFCDTPGVICVAATGPTAQASPFGPWTDVDAPAYYTNFGHKAIDVAAPGGNNDVTFVYAACSHTSLYLAAFGITCSTLSVIGAEGTSMSAPHVAGTAALLVSSLGRHPEKIKARIEQTADRIGGGALRAFYGHGRLNVFRAVTAHEDLAAKEPHSH